MTKYIVSVPVTVICLVVLVFGVGCDSGAKTGAVAGGAVGAGTGAIIGHQSGKTGQGALIGGAIGAGTGFLLGNAQDKKKHETATPAKSEKQDAANIVTVNIANSNGSITPVKLAKQGENSYVGPKGEVYDHLPTEAELKPVYGF
ncbi:MAG: glycine zipper domain-containing protein [Sedimentisphaerales bacterium]